MSNPTPTLGADEDRSTDETIGLNVHALLFQQHRSQKQLALVLGLTPSVLSKKLRGDSAWSARQVAVTAGYLNVEAGRLFAQPSVWELPPKLALIRGDGTLSRHIGTNRPLVTIVPELN